MNLTAALISLSLSLTGLSDADFGAAIEKALGGTKPDQMTAAYLDTISFAHLDARAEAYEGLKTPEDVRAWQTEKRNYFVEAIGGFPDRAPLNARVVGAGEGEGFRYEKVIFESVPGLYVTGVLFLPVTDGPWPAVVVPCGHSANGKAAEAYQRASILLARHGIAAFCYDPIGQGERVTYLKEDGSAAVGSTIEHTLLDVGAILTGTSIAQYRIWDGMRAIDYLQSRPDIIADKIGASGNSGGGTLSSYIMALDERVAAAAPSCYVTSWKRLLETIGPQDGEQNIFGQIKHGLDHADYLHLRAPKPTLMLTATRDFFDIEGSWDTFREAKRVYTRLGVPERVGLVETDATHGFSIELRQGMVQWMQRWLLGVDAPVTEVNFGILSDADMQCTPEGQVAYLERARSVLDLNVERAESLKARRAAFWRHTPRAEVIEKVRALAGIRPEGALPAPAGDVLAEETAGGHRIQDLLITTEPGIVLPARAWIPASGTIAKARLIAPGDGLASAQPHIDAGIGVDEAVLAVSVRGTGLTENFKWKGAWQHVGNDFSDFMRAYLNTLSYVGMRAEDLTQVAAWWADETGAPLSLHATGEATVPALHAAAIQPDRFAHVTLEGGIPTWQAVVETPRPHNQLINTVHNALAWYDLDLLEALIPEERLTVTGAAVPAF